MVVTPPMVPVHADVKDMVWEPKIKELAHAMVLLGAKAALIEYYTDLPHSYVARLYKALLNRKSPSGPVSQTTPKWFCRHPKYPLAMNVQSRMFLDCYGHLENSLPETPKEGWLHLAAFNAYRDLLEMQGQKPLLDMNQTWALLVRYGSGSQQGRGEIRKTHCIQCGMRYLLDATAEIDSQGCPTCALQAQFNRLATQRKGGSPASEIAA